MLQCGVPLSISMRTATNILTYNQARSGTDKLDQLEDIKNCVIAPDFSSLFSTENEQFSAKYSDMPSKTECFRTKAFIFSDHLMLYQCW